ncbi:predicted protein [Histoplasma capsulatum H143]|uniref:Uncharacterized protein n=1 Tax=Ajellomyces capsulatus (strain H143) TaxID=544712 RepID=C6HP64_AJECH|nr:predicted protein [Histoplasma capsulatum H143]
MDLVCCFLHRVRELVAAFQASPGYLRLERIGIDDLFEGLSCFSLGGLRQWGALWRRRRGQGFGAVAAPAAAAFAGIMPVDSIQLLAKYFRPSWRANPYTGHSRLENRATKNSGWLVQVTGLLVEFTWHWTIGEPNKCANLDHAIGQDNRDIVARQAPANSYFAAQSNTPPSWTKWTRGLSIQQDYDLDFMHAPFPTHHNSNSL